MESKDIVSAADLSFFEGNVSEKEGSGARGEKRGSHVVGVAPKTVKKVKKRSQKEKGGESGESSRSASMSNVDATTVDKELGAKIDIVSYAFMAASFGDFDDEVNIDTTLTKIAADAEATATAANADNTVSEKIGEGSGAVAATATDAATAANAATAATAADAADAASIDNDAATDANTATSANAADAADAASIDNDAATDANTATSANAATAADAASAAVGAVRPSYSAADIFLSSVQKFQDQDSESDEGSSLSYEDIINYSTMSSAIYGGYTESYPDFPPRARRGTINYGWSPTRGGYIDSDDEAVPADSTTDQDNHAPDAVPIPDAGLANNDDANAIPPPAALDVGMIPNIPDADPVNNDDANANADADADADADLVDNANANDDADADPANDDDANADADADADLVNNANDDADADADADADPVDDDDANADADADADLVDNANANDDADADADANPVNVDDANADADADADADLVDNANANDDANALSGPTELSLSPSSTPTPTPSPSQSTLPAPSPSPSPSSSPAPASLSNPTSAPTPSPSPSPSPSPPTSIFCPEAPEAAAAAAAAASNEEQSPDQRECQDVKLYPAPQDSLSIHDTTWEQAMNLLPQYSAVRDNLVPNRDGGFNLQEANPASSTSLDDNDEVIEQKIDVEEYSCESYTSIYVDGEETLAKSLRLSPNSKMTTELANWLELDIQKKEVFTLPNPSANVADFERNFSKKYVVVTISSADKKVWVTNQTFEVVDEPFTVDFPQLPGFPTCCNLALGKDLRDLFFQDSLLDKAIHRPTETIIKHCQMANGPALRVLKKIPLN